MTRHLLLALALGVPAVALAQDAAPEAGAGLVRTYTVSLTSGLASTFQPPLGPTFGAGPAVEDKLTFSLNNLFRKDDAVTAFGWNTTDIPSVTPDWMAGILYRTPLVHTRKHSLTVTGGLQRWILRDVASGSNDWIFSGNLTYGTKWKNIPFFVSEDSWSLLGSTLPKGSGVYTRVFTQHRLVRREGFELLLRHGPEHAYSWNFYGVNGQCVMRYEATLVAAWKGNQIEAGYRRQFALQPMNPNDGFWTFTITRRLTRPFHGD